MPVQYVCRRKLKSGGVTYKHGDDIPAEVIAGWHNPQVYIEQGWIAIKDDTGVPLTRGQGASHATKTVAKRQGASLFPALLSACNTPETSKATLIRIAERAGIQVGQRQARMKRENLVEWFRVQVQTRTAAKAPAAPESSVQPEPSPPAPVAIPQPAAEAAPAPAISTPEAPEAHMCPECGKSFKTAAAVGSHRFGSHGIKGGSTS